MNPIHHEGLRYLSNDSFLRELLENVLLPVKVSNQEEEIWDPRNIGTNSGDW